MSGLSLLYDLLGPLESPASESLLVIFPPYSGIVKSQSQEPFCVRMRFPENQCLSQSHDAWEFMPTAELCRTVSLFLGFGVTGM